MNRERPCEVCHGGDVDLLLSSERLDGPLVRCRGCSFVYVGSREHDFTFREADAVKSSLLAERVRALGLFDPATEAAEAQWRMVVAIERLQDLQRHGASGRLLEIGCADGEFLAVAKEAGYEVAGLEADPGSCAAGRARGFDVRTGTIAAAGWSAGPFDAVALYHVIEHLDSPRAMLDEIHPLLAPQGLLAIETPNIDTLWFNILGPRWRQLIPDHYFFFSPRTIALLLRDTGFQPIETRRVGKPMSLRLFLDRVSRLNRPLGRAALALARVTGLGNLTIRVNLGDVIRIHARRDG
ncbi:MAG: methyltransferase domain-containing protein [Acidobacteria bacterium]|nr:methyltransferase domain-containing protein [Acidobacteriota bacterium]